ncbi:MAG: Mur ligase family protein [Cystobacterineae bacterium]|nr:Mur ligase family protein [Cystobacterineae bacterium]
MSEETSNGNVVQSLPAHARRLHLLGIGGTGMGTLACMLKESGFEITGSDQNLYPPMSLVLEKADIPLFMPYAAKNVENAKPDLVVVGNVIRKENPEAAAVRALGLPQMSMPALLWEVFLKHKHVICVAGTHGKTTTAMWLAHVLKSAGKKPSWLVGGVNAEDGKGYGLGEGELFVIEGDEYDTAYFDKGPKFFHYGPQTLLLTSVEYDHADIYADMQAYESAFFRLTQNMPSHGYMATSQNYPNAVRMALAAPCRAETYASRPTNPAADYGPLHLRYTPTGVELEVEKKGRLLGTFALPLFGLQNVENALGIIAVGQSLGLSVQALQTGLQSFQGIWRRQETSTTPRGILLIDDFAHHPTAVRETVQSVAERFCGRRLWALFEPRSNTSRRKLHQEDYAQAFEKASHVRIKKPLPHDKILSEEALDVQQLAKALRQQGKNAQVVEHVDSLVEELATQTQSGDVVLCMSNGNFDGLKAKLLKQFERE